MRCEELREWLSADLDGEARGVERAAVREHLAACPECRRARAAAEGLRDGLRLASRERVTEERDEALLAVLRDEGRFGAETGFRLQGQPGAIRSLWSACLGGLPPLSGKGSLGPAAVAMTLSFVVTWGSLRWAEAGRAASVRIPTSLPATARLRPPDGELLDEWMAGTPSLAAFSRLQRRPASAPAAPALLKRGAVLRERRRVG
jgi:anti-sigma factor RsiW